MSNLFAITTTTKTLRLDEKRQGEAVFTVFNAAGRPVRGRALLHAEDPRAEDWLSLAGDVERDFPIAGTEQYSVRITVPPEAPPGSYLFRLDIVGVERPDEDYTRGQTVTCEVPEAVQKKPFPAWIVLVALGVLLLGGLVVMWPFDGKEETERDPGETTVEVPPVSSLAVAEARAALDEAVLVVDSLVQIPDESVDSGAVVHSDPPAGERIAPESGVTLFVSTGPFGSVSEDFVGTWEPIDDEDDVERLVIEEVDADTLFLDASIRPQPGFPGPIVTPIPSMEAAFSPMSFSGELEEASSTTRITVSVADPQARRLEVRIRQMMSIIPGRPPSALVDTTAELQRREPFPDQAFLSGRTREPGH